LSNSFHESNGAAEVLPRNQIAIIRKPRWPFTMKSGVRSSSAPKAVHNHARSPSGATALAPHKKWEPPDQEPKNGLLAASPRRSNPMMRIPLGVSRRSDPMELTFRVLQSAEMVEEFLPLVSAQLGQLFQDFGFAHAEA